MALAGNPSDGYGGAVLAVTLVEFRAEADARAAPTLKIDPPSELVELSVRRFARELEPAGALAELALAVETEDLGITAGLQDRVAQAYGGLMFMDFSSGSYEQLDPRLLPPLVVAWSSDTAQQSDEAHRSLRGRFDQGERELATAMRDLAVFAWDARAAVIACDREALARAMDGTFDVRRRMIELDPRHVEMIECARDLGASANYTGSGGAIVAVCRGEEHRRAVGEGLAGLGCSIAVAG